MKILEEDPPLADDARLPWPIDAALYPSSAAGMVHLAIFCLGPPALGCINRLILSRIPFGTLIALVLSLLLAAYALYYLAYCTFDSSKGGKRAPDTFAQDAPDKSELVSQLFLILGTVAICFWPAVVYCSFTHRADVVFWLLTVCGVFLFPMALLVAVLFDAIHALNPIFIISSLLKTLPNYLGLVLFYCIFFALVAAVVSNLHGLSAPQNAAGIIFYPAMFINYFFSARFIYKAAPLAYLGMIGAHLIGRFYWWHKDKLDWGL